MLIPFEAKDVDFILEFGANYIRFYRDHEMVMKNNYPYEVQTPYLDSEVEDIKYIQNGDYLYLFHKNHPIMTLAMYAEDNWLLEEFELKNGAWEHVNTTDTAMQISATTGNITITSDDVVFSENDIGRLVRITCIDSQKTAWQAEKSGIAQGQILYSDGKYYQAQSAGTTGTVKPVHTEGIISDGSILFKYMHSGYGTARITGFTSATTVSAAVIDTFPDELTSQSSPYWELGIIHQGMSYPECGTFYRGRFCFMYNDNGIPTVCMSCSDDYDNFADKEHGQVLATSAITIPVTGIKRNEPCWLVSADVLFVGTSSAEYYIDSASSAEPLAPDNVKIQQISSIGSLPIQPVKIGAHTIFVTKSGTSVRDIIYSFSTDAYDPIELSIYGKHLLSSGITGMAYQEYPDKVVWFTVKDGRLIGLTFSAEQQVNAVHQHTLGGDVVNVATIHNYDNNLDELWLTVERSGDGVTYPCIEWLDNGYPVVYPDEIIKTTDYRAREIAEANYMKENAFYVDCGITVTSSQTTEKKTISGLSRLTDQEVAIMTDGAEQPQQTVTNGHIEVEGSAVNITVGLPIESQYIPQTLYIQANNGAGVGDVQRIDHVTLMLWRSLSGKVGEDFDKLQDIYFRGTDEPMGKSSPLYTGNKEIPVDMRTSFIKEKGATVIIHNDSVFPMNILAIAPHFTTSGNGK